MGVEVQSLVSTHMHLIATREGGCWAAGWAAGLLASCDRAFGIFDAFGVFAVGFGAFAALGFAAFGAFGALGFAALGAPAGFFAMALVFLCWVCFAMAVPSPTALDPGWRGGFWPPPCRGAKIEFNSWRW